MAAGKTNDVFISHAAADAAFALEAAQACRAAGLTAVASAELASLPTGKLGDIVWDALAESWALLVILSSREPTPTMFVEIGAAQAWNKPVFVILTDPLNIRLPAALAKSRLYPTGRLSDAVADIKASVQPLSDGDREALVELYAGDMPSVDQLALDPQQMGELAVRFHQTQGKAVPGERLLAELLRLRKLGKLVRRRSKRAKATA